MFPCIPFDFEGYFSQLNLKSNNSICRKFVLISAHGTQIVSKLRPADHLRQLLIDNGGADNDVVKAFFEMHSEVQAAATALVLACSQSVQDAQESTTCIISGEI